MVYLTALSVFPPLSCSSPLNTSPVAVFPRKWPFSHGLHFARPSRTISSILLFLVHLSVLVPDSTALLPRAPGAPAREKYRGVLLLRSPRRMLSALCPLELLHCSGRGQIKVNKTIRHTNVDGWPICDRSEKEQGRASKAEPGAWFAVFCSCVVQLVVHLWWWCNCD